MLAMQAAWSIRQRLVALVLLGNLGGAVLSFIYFHEVDPIAGGIDIGAAELAFFAACFSLLSVVAQFASSHWMRPINEARAQTPGRAAGDVARRRALLMPAFMAVLTLTG